MSLSHREAALAARKAASKPSKTRPGPRPRQPLVHGCCKSEAVGQPSGGITLSQEAGLSQRPTRHKEPADEDVIAQKLTEFETWLAGFIEENEEMFHRTDCVVDEAEMARLQMEEIKNEMQIASATAQDASRDLHILGFERQQRDNFVDRHRSSCLGICSEISTYTGKSVYKVDHQLEELRATFENMLDAQMGALRTQYQIAYSQKKYDQTVVSLQQLKQKMIDEYGEEPPDLPVVAASLPSTPQALAEASGLNSPRSTGHRTRTKHGKYLPQGSPLPGVSKVEVRVSSENSS
mmetsp:Transcript_22987/g.48302  ORF Transcript_22987/g.48302 Transcript_22987/m.48302 type:complete len:293 (+) Transcript_22987:294-1172(+)